MKKGLFITVEGIEGAGKSTAIQSVTEALDKTATEHIITREPGGTPLAEDIRHLLLKPRNEEVTSDTELLLMYACRSQLINTVINPALNRGVHVVSDRFNDASFAYQGGGRNISLEFIQLLDTWVLHDLKPELTILLDLPVEIGLQRASKRGAKDRIEQETLAFFEKVRASYLQRAANDPDRFIIIDATESPQQVRGNILSAIENLIKKNS